MQDQPPLQLEELFFPAPEVRACPAHDPQGETRGTTVKQSFDLLVLDASTNSYGLLLDISSDDDKRIERRRYVSNCGYGR